MSAASTTSRAATRLGGWSLIAAAVGFMAVFGYLAARFNYPAVLDGNAADVLPRLLALGETGRAAWAAYAMLPLLLIPPAIGARAALGGVAPNGMRAALVVATIAAVSMLLGLARWPSIHWELARAYATATPDARSALDALFLGLNVYLGNYLGEFVGELALNAFFVLVGSAALRSATTNRWVGFGGIGVGVIGWGGAFRNVTSVAAPIAEATNYLLPLWLIVLGVVLIRWRPLATSFAGSTPVGTSRAGSITGAEQPSAERYSLQPNRFHWLNDQANRSATTTTEA